MEPLASSARTNTGKGRFFVFDIFLQKASQSALPFTTKDFLLAFVEQSRIKKQIHKVVLARKSQEEATLANANAVMSTLVITTDVSVVSRKSWVLGVGEASYKCVLTRNVGKRYPEKSFKMKYGKTQEVLLHHHLPTRRKHERTNKKEGESVLVTIEETEEYSNEEIEDQPSASMEVRDDSEAYQRRSIFGMGSQPDNQSQDESSASFSFGREDNVLKHGREAVFGMGSKPDNQSQDESSASFSFGREDNVLKHGREAICDIDPKLNSQEDVECPIQMSSKSLESKDGGKASSRLDLNVEGDSKADRQEERVGGKCVGSKDGTRKRKGKFTFDSWTNAVTDSDRLSSNTASHAVDGKGNFSKYIFI